jgi:hypothetical protein
MNEQSSIAAQRFSPTVLTTSSSMSPQVLQYLASLSASQDSHFVKNAS